MEDCEWSVCLSRRERRKTAGTPVLGSHAAAAAWFRVFLTLVRRAAAAVKIEESGTGTMYLLTAGSRQFSPEVQTFSRVFVACVCLILCSARGRGCVGFEQ